MTLPNFIIAGVPRAGTTSLVGYLRQHPQIFMAEGEPRFFLHNPDPTDTSEVYDLKIDVRSLPEYEALFEGVTDEKAIGEKTPFYIYAPGAMGRIKATLPDVRLVFSLRNPIERAYSSYWLAVRNGQDVGSVEEFLTPSSDYIATGYYYAYLCRWYQTFDPARIKVVIFDDLKQSPQAVFQDLCRFLEVDDGVVLADTTAKNAGAKPSNRALAKTIKGIRSSAVFETIRPMIPKAWREPLKQMEAKNYEKPPAIDKDLVARLRPLFEDDIRQLEGLLGRDLSVWRTRP
jgi:hypothetical protein